MNYDRGFGFIGGLLLGGVIGAAIALLMAPASGEETREQIRAEGVALKQRGQDFGNDRVHDAQNMVKQGQKSVSEAQEHFSTAMQDQKDKVHQAAGSR